MILAEKPFCPSQVRSVRICSLFQGGQYIPQFIALFQTFTQRLSSDDSRLASLTLIA